MYGAEANLMRLAATIALALSTLTAPAQVKGPLRPHPDNPRYFTDGSARSDGSLKVVYLTGSHTWANLIDRGPADPPPAFDFDAYLDLLERHGHNFARLWGRQLSWYPAYGERELHAGPLAWPRSGPGLARDGQPKFDLARFDPAYFERLRSRAEAAGRRGVYVSFMFFGGYQETGPNWAGSPFHRDNNVNGVDGDPDRDGNGSEAETLAEIPAAVAAIQKAYVRKVIEAVGDLDNVLYEIANEGGETSNDWQYDLVRYVKEVERERPKQHPVGMTAGYWTAAENRAVLDESPADWVSYLFEAVPPKGQEAYGVEDPFPADGRKVSVMDSDHWWVVPIYGDAAVGRRCVWKGFCRGHNPILMEHLPPASFVQADHPLSTDDPGYAASRAAMGLTRRLAERIDLAAMTPRGELSSTGFCLAAPGEEYLVYQPRSEAFTLRLPAGRYAFEWLDPAAGAALETGVTDAADGETAFAPPAAADAVLRLRAEREPGTS